MNTQSGSDNDTSFALELFQPKPDIFYSLDTAAHLAEVPRRSLLLYCRAGLIRPVIQPPYGVLEFTEEAIYAVRRIEHLRTLHGLDLSMIKILLELFDEVQRLRTEFRYLDENPSRTQFG